MGNTASNVSTAGVSLTLGSSDEDEPGSSGGKKSGIGNLHSSSSPGDVKSQFVQSTLRPSTGSATSTVASAVLTKATCEVEGQDPHRNNKNKNVNNVNNYNNNETGGIKISGTSNSIGTPSRLSIPQSINIATQAKGSPLPSSWSSVASNSASSTSTAASSPESHSPASASSKILHSIKSNNHSKLPFDIDAHLRTLFDIGSRKSYSKTFPLPVNDIKQICQVAAQVFMSQPVMLQLGSPVKVVGDIHGQFVDLMRIFNLCGLPPRSSYLFLGDYVDRGKQSLETILLLLLLKIKYPENVFLLRGNHECANVTKVYGFYDECKRRIPGHGVKCWKALVDVFNTMPIAATIGGKIFCVHGGLSPALKSLDDISSVTRPTDIPDTGLLSDLLWSDPDPAIYQWAESDRGVSHCFGKIIVERFCRKFKFDLIARGHMVVEDGYEFFDRRKLVTIFSAPNYCGEFGNWGAVMSVDKHLLCSFDLLKPNTVHNGRRRKVERS